MHGNTGRAVTCVVTCWLIAAVGSELRAQPPEFRGLWVEVWHEGFKSAVEIDALVSRAVAGNYNAILAEVLP